MAGKLICRIDLSAIFVTAFSIIGEAFFNGVITNIIFFRLTAAAELAYYTPQEMAYATVDGILKNKQYVTLPFFLRKMLIFAR